MKIIGIDDEKKKLELNKQKLLITTTLIILSIIVLILIIVYVNNKDFKDFMDKYVLMKNVMENNVTSIQIDESEVNTTYAYDKYIAVFTGNKLRGYNSSGEKEYELTVEVSNPIIDTNNRFLLVGEKGKQKIYLIAGKEILWEKELEGNISRVSVNKNGYVSVVLTGTTYKSIIQTFDLSGKELFKTYLSSSFVVDTDISYDNKYLSFAEVSASGTLVQSMIKTISIQKAQEKPSESIINTVTSPSDSTVLNLKYQDGNKLICMYDSSIQIINGDNAEELINLKQNDKKITFADIELNNTAYFVTEKSSLLNTETIVELVNSSTKKINTYTVDRAVKEVYSYQDQVALNLGSEVNFIGTNGWLNRRYISSQEVRKIVMASGFAGIVYKDKIEIVEM